MANLYVASTGSNTAPYDTWAKAATAPETAVNAAAAGDTVYIHGEAFTLGADTTWTLAGTAGSPVRVICSNDKTNAPPQTLSTAGSYVNASTALDWTISGAGYVYGFGHSMTGSTTSTININIANTDLDDIILEDVTFDCSLTTGLSALNVSNSSSINTSALLRNCAYTLGGHANSLLRVGCNFEMIGGSVSGTGAYTSVIVLDRAGSPDFLGVDFSSISSASATVYAPASQVINGDVRFINCIQPSSASMIGSFTGLDQGEIIIADSASGDQHYQFQHYNCYGSTIPDTGIYANDGASYDGTNKYSWKIVTTAYATFHTPYYSRWFYKYHSATSAITPYIEILRDGNTGAYNDNQVWAEFGCKTTAGSTLMSFSNDRKSLLAAAANQDAGVGLSGWTGEMPATAWSGKCVAPASVTPAEIGALMARVIVGEPSITVYADPYIRT